MTKNRMYIDEVGNPDLNSSDDPNHRFLSLTGVILDLNHVKDVVHPQMESLKARLFGSHPDEPIILHRKEIMNAKPPFGALRDAEARKVFDLKDSFERLWNNGTDFVGPDQFQKSFTSRQLKVKPKTANISGLQLADLLAHPSRADILNERNLLGRPLAAYSKSIIEILRTKYDQRGGVVYGRKFI